MPGHAVRCVAYLLPRRARDVQVAASGRVVRRGAAGRRVEMWPELPGFWLRLSYTL
jgi:hypothetical protein